jgi:hypothetical protein
MTDNGESPHFEQWEGELPVLGQQLAGQHMAPESAKLQSCERQIAAAAKRIALHCVDLQLEKGQQYHVLPNTVGKRVILAEYEHDTDGKPIHLRLTSNVIHNIKVYLYSVDIADYCLRFASAGLTVVRGNRMIQGAPEITADAALPVIWQGPDNRAGRYNGKLYSPGLPRGIVNMLDESQLETRLEDIRTLEQTTVQLSRGVSWEAEYPYE